MKVIKSGNRFSLFFTITAILICAAAARAEDVRSAVTAGQKAPPFQARTVYGQTISFPGDYKGKVVLLDFWATWCRPCRAELPNVAATYQKFHAYGFDALSVSLDDPRQGPALLQFFRVNGMTWPQIYDGLAWQTPVALAYGIKAIPCPVLVDGDTGKIIAQCPDALGEDLPELVEKNLAAKNQKLPGSGPYNPNAPDKLTVVINSQTITAWRTGQLKDAEKAALAEHKPIAWIASDHRYWGGIGEISESGPRGATLHALYALRDKTVLVFQDAFTEDRSALPSVDEALRTLNPDWIPPFIVFLNPDGKQVLAKVPFESDFVKRAQALANALGKAEVKMDTAPNAASK